MKDVKIEKAIELVNTLIDVAIEEADIDKEFENYEVDGIGRADIELDNSMFNEIVGALDTLDIRYWLADIPKINVERKYKLWIFCVSKLDENYDLSWGISRIEEEG